MQHEITSVYQVASHLAQSDEQRDWVANSYLPDAFDLAGFINTDILNVAYAVSINTVSNLFKCFNGAKDVHSGGTVTRGLCWVSEGDEPGQGSLNPYAAGMLVMAAWFWDECKQIRSCGTSMHFLTAMSCITQPQILGHR